MNPLPRDFTLPDLQARLDALDEGALLHISTADYERLFGINDVAAARLRNFAKGHACAVSYADTAVLFRKKLNQTRREAERS